MHFSQPCAIVKFTFDAARVVLRPKIEGYRPSGPKGRCIVEIPKLILSIIDVAAAIFLVAVVLLQSGKSAGLSGAIAGGADTFLSKNKAKTLDAKLAKMTKWVAILWIIITLVLSLI